MVPVATLESKTGSRISIAYDPGQLEPLAREGNVDTYIVATKDGFSPLGSNRRFLSADLGVPEDEIRRLANWNRFDNALVTLVALQSRRPDSHLRGVILAAAETSECYKSFAVPTYGQPYRDFYYNVTYEASAFAAKRWEARRIAISHLSASGRFHEDIATCNAEALAHHCDGSASSIESFVFLGCCISQAHLSGIQRLNAEGELGKPRPISTQTESRDGVVLVHVRWRYDA